MKIETAKVIHHFLGGARCEKYRELLGEVYRNPDFESREQNQLRAAALLAAKPVDNWMEFVAERYEEGVLFDSLYEWTIEELSRDLLDAGLGIDGATILGAVEQFCSDSLSAGWSKRCIVGGLERWAGAPPSFEYDDGTTAPNDAVTIWRVEPDGRYRCLDGNHRIHRLAHACHEGDDECITGWKVWVGRFRQGLPRAAERIAIFPSGSL